MAVLVEDRAGGDPNRQIADQRENSILQWHESRDLLAVASFSDASGGEVNFFTKKGGKSTTSYSSGRQIRISSIAWNPVYPLVAVGWTNGVATTFHVDKDEESVIRSDEADEPIVACFWNPAGTVLMVAHSQGDVSIFELDEKAEKVKPASHSINIGDEITCACSKVSVKKAKAVKTIHDEVENEEDRNLFAQVVRAKERTGLIIPAGKVENETTIVESAFLLAAKRGNIFVVTPEGLHTKVFQIENVAKQILFNTEKNLILVLTADMMFYQIECPTDDGMATEKLRVKLGGKGAFFQAVDVDDGLIAMSYGEKEIRVWDLLNEDNAIVKLSPEKGFEPTDFVTTISYSPRKECITGATQCSKMATWKRSRGTEDEAIDRQWRLQPAITTELPVVTLCWANVTNSLAVNYGSSVTLFSEQSVLTHCNLPYSLMQTGQQTLTFAKLLEPIESQEIRLPIVPIGLYIAAKNFLLWNADEVFVYEIISSTSPISFNFIFSFKCSPKDAAIAQQNIFTLEKDKINVRTFQGTVKRAINFPEMEGDPVLMDFNDKWMCAGTTNGFIRVFDLSGKDIHQPFSAKYVLESVPSFGHFVRLKINGAGNRVSCTLCNANGDLDDRLFVWDGEADSLGFFSVHSGATDVQIYEAEAEMSTIGNRPKTAAARKIEKDKSRYSMPEHLPGRHCWDQRDPRFLVCEINHQNGDVGPNYMLTMFVTSEHGIQIQDRISKPSKVESLLNVAVPFMYFLKKNDSDEEDDLETEQSLTRLLLRRTLREFVGIDGSDAKTTEAMLDFSFYLTIGQMDNAFKAIKFIKSESVWEHMAHMCVKTRRLDVAAVCLGNMGHARGARALRQAKQSGATVDEQVAVLAIQLGLIEEAEFIYASIGRFDLLNKLYQAQNKWKEAFEVAERVDRIHLRNTFYNYAKFLEGMGSMEEAIAYYERSKTHHFEIPRMLFEDAVFLEEYLKRHRDPHLQKWWAQFLESTGEFEGAVNYYTSAMDYLSVVRILCAQEKVEEAAKVAEDHKDRAACYHLARHFEAHEQPQRAVEFFTKAQTFSSAIRLAKEHDMADQLANLSLLAGGSDLVEAAKYYEELPGYADKAVMLYHKAGMIGRALDLAFKTDQFSALDLIAKELDENSDPRVLERSAQFFANNQQYKKAVQLLAFAKNFDSAIELCRRTNVPMTEELAEAISPTKEAIPSSSERNKLLEKIAECCLQQSNYHYAAKKFAQAGNKIQAMRALIKSGDTPKIILFANTARNKDIYRIAGNYLQTINWKEDTNIMKHIENFYSRAGAFDSLAGFFESCAEVELEEYHDYEKTAIALAESVRHLNRALEKNHDSYLVEKRIEIESRIRMIQEFLGIREIYENDPGEAMRRLTALTEHPKADKFLRLGDVYAILIIHNAKRSNFKKAHQMMEQMQQKLPRVDITDYIVADVLDQICDEVKAPRVTIGRDRRDEADEAEGSVEYSHAMRKQMGEKSFYEKLDE
ncbi:hypothetical protein L596_022998 [Steinernema carpocapsae]|uniref:Uncharacterized protein n=1 Tax=Steinernema carpocapsae TaxID=34508 RepID=A0A4U5MCJ3_STECR|nr:hypothetical protein L596_022998 [Steinernema carpocapsae]